MSQLNDNSVRDKLLSEKIDMNILQTNGATANANACSAARSSEQQLKSSKYLNYMLSIICLLLITCLFIIIFTNLNCFHKLQCLKQVDKSFNSSLESSVNSNLDFNSSNQLSLNQYSSSDFNAQWNSSRLPFNLKPYHYVINLKIDVHNKSFSGDCTIYFKCLEQTQILVVHSDSNLEFDAGYLPIVSEIDSSNLTVSRLKVKSMQKNNFFSYLIIRLDDALLFKKSRNYFVKFENFKSEITNNLKGIYLSSYNLNGTNRPLVVSQLQPLDARRVFPSFDEPNLKAKFKISIENHKEFTALSNMEEMSVVETQPGWTRTEFDVTPLMSTYILAFVVSDFKHASTTGPHGLKIRVWAREDYINNTDYAIGVIPRAFEFFEDYFNISEVVKKSDHFAAPDLNAGAMENWGLVIYRESVLLYDEEKSLLEDEYYILLVVTHEISHSWFGNMATLKWWDNVWLNEAFANTFMYFAMDHIRPEFNVADTHVVHDTFAVMEKDSVETSHPVSTYVEDPREIQQYFDEISYEKGLAVLRMLRGFIGDEDFKQSIRNHITRYKFSNCDMNQLWEIISETVNNKFNVSEIMTGWLTQMGYPVVNVTRTIKGNTIEYNLKQDYFILFQLYETKNNYKWIIPFTYKIENSSENQLIWINYTDATIRLPLENGNENKWLLGNLNFMGYFRVNYDKDNWLKIIAQLKRNHKEFSTTERAALIFDSFTFARVGYLDYSIPLELASYLINEEDYVPWKSFFKSIAYLDNLLSTSSCYGLFQLYGAKQLERVYSKLGWNNTGSYLEKLLRTHVIKYSSYFEHEDAVRLSREIFSRYMNDTKPEKHIVEAVYCTGIKYGNYKDWIALFNKSINLMPHEQNVIWQALVCSKDLWILKSFLEMTMNETIIRRSDLRRIFTYYGFSALSRSVYFEFVMNRWDELLAKFGTDPFIMSTMLETLAVGITDKYSLDRIEKMLARGAGSATNTPNFIMNQIKTNIKWFNNYGKTTCDFLRSYNF